MAEYSNTSLTWFEMFDPSEAIRSEEIMDELSTSFEIVEVRPYGGTILHHMLSGIAGNFDPANDADNTILRMLAAFEELMEEHRVIKSDFASVVARPRPL